LNAEQRATGDASLPQRNKTVLLYYHHRLQSSETNTNTQHSIYPNISKHFTDLSKYSHLIEYEAQKGILCS